MTQGTRPSRIAVVKEDVTRRLPCTPTAVGPEPPRLLRVLSLAPLPGFGLIVPQPAEIGLEEGTLLAQVNASPDPFYLCICCDRRRFNLEKSTCSSRGYPASCIRKCEIPYYLGSSSVM